jgi:hypothetical protein
MTTQNKDNDLPSKWTSRIPLHLSNKESVEWEKDLKWEIEEHERRKKEGFYGSDGRKKEAKKRKSKHSK